MLLKKCMTPASKVVSCYPDDLIEFVLDKTIEHPEVGCVVVLHPTGHPHIPVGIVTKTDLLQAYKEKLDLENIVETIMSHNLETLHENQTVDDAATHFERTKHHHAFVVNKDEQWIGLITAWDVATELARDNRAWPWNREATEMLEAKYSPHIHKKTLSDVAKHPKDVDPHSFLGIAGANE